MRSTAVFLVPLMGVCASCATSGLPTEPIVRDYELQQWVSPRTSGLRIIVQEDHSSDLVTVVSVFGSGSTSDPKGREGLAHFVEHLAFRSRAFGTPVWDHLKKLGADFNAFTADDITAYHVATHKDNLEAILQLEAWRLVGTVDGVTQNVFDIEREVVRNERRQRHETTIGNELFEKVNQALFPPGHPLSRSGVGSHDSLSAITLADARAFTKTHYRPENCTIVISGAVDTDQVKRLLGKWPAEILFGPGGPNGTETAPRPRIADRPLMPVPAPHTTTLQRHKGPVVQPTLVLAWALPGAYRPESGPTEFLAGSMNLAIGSGLRLDLYDDDDIEGAGAFAIEQADASMLVIQASLKPGADPERARKRLLDTVSDIWTDTEGITVMTEAARWFTATDLVMSLGQPVDKAVALATYMSATGKNAYFKETLNRLHELRASEVRDLAYKWLKRDRSVAVYFAPEAEQAIGVTAGSSGAGNNAPTRATHDLGQETSSAANSDLGPEAIRRVARVPHLAGLPRFRMDNGLDVVVLKHGTAPVAKIDVVMRGGQASVQPEGAAGLALSFSRSRCHDHGDLGALGGSLSMGLDSSSTYASVQLMSGNVANGIAVLADELACRAPEEETFLHLKRILDVRARTYDRLAKRPETIAAKRFAGALYPDHPFGRTSYDPRTLKDLRPEDTLGFLKNTFRADNAVAVISGDVDPKEVKALAETYFRRWTGTANGSRAGLPSLPPPPHAPAVFLVDRKDATQAQIDVGCRLADVRAEALAAYDVLQKLAGTQAWLLREEWGATYGVHAQITKRPGGAADLVLDGLVENGKVGASVARLVALIEGLGKGQIEERPFLDARWDVARTFASRFATTEGMVSGVLGAERQGWPQDVWDRYPERLANTTIAAVAALATPCVGKTIVSIVGNASMVRPELEAAGIKLEQ